MKKILTAIAAAFISAGMLAQPADKLPLAAGRPAPQAKHLIKAKSAESSLSARPLFTRPATRTAAAQQFAGRKLFGSLINSSAWTDATVTSVPYGIYSFEIGGDNPSAVITSNEYDFLSGAYRRGKFFGISAMMVMGAFNGARYITIDMTRQQEIKNIKYSPDNLAYALLPSAMAYNPIDDRIYSIQYNEDLSGMDWCVYNETYDSMDKLCKFRGLYNVLTLAATPDGEMYFINGSGDLYHIDRQNARPRLIGRTGVSPILYSQSMMYDARTGMFLWAALTDTGSQLYAVDPATAESFLVEEFSNNEEFVSLYSTENLAPDAAPAQPENLELTYSGEGSLSGTLSFTVPSTTYGGTPLKEASVYVWLDGECVKTGTVTAGESVTMPVELTEGNHYIAVNLKNDGGYSPLSSLYQYAGYDIPESVGNVTFTNAEGTNTVKWDAPENGVNGGYIAKEALTYTIVRMPDSVTVATGLTANEFSEPTPADMHNYSYRVYAVNNGKTSQYTESESIICGSAFTAPYSQDFSNASTLADFFTVIDANNDDNTWRTGYDSDIRIDINTQYHPNGDDWLITPALSLDGGSTYHFTMNMKTFTNGYPESFELYLGTDPSDLTTFTMFGKEDALELYEDYSDYTASFNVDKAGTYYVGLRYTSDANKNGTMLIIKSVGVTKMGMSKAPQAPSDMTVTPAADDIMEATVELTAPTKTLEGEALDGLTAVKVYRNGAAEPVHVFTSPQPGSKLSWTDNAVAKVGKNTYAAVAENSFGDGEKTSASSFIGVYTAPYAESFDDIEASELYKSTFEGIDLEVNTYYGWKYDKYNHRMSCYSFVSNESELPATAWLYTPKMKLDGDAVYEFAYDTNINLYVSTITNAVYMGTDTVPEAQTTKVGDMPISTNYQMQHTAHQIVTTDGGKYFFGFNSVSTALNDYNSVDIDNITLSYLKSARSPFRITGYTAEADKGGETKVSMAFNAPAVDYHGDRLTESLKVEIYRGQSPTPVFTKSDVAPGTGISWTDTQAAQGNNVYTISATNQYGRSEVLTDTVFAGRDIPEAVSAISAKGVNGNMDAQLTWNAPAAGINGGVVITDELTYNVYSYDLNEGSYTLLADNVKDCTYTAANGTLSEQAIYYYAVEPVSKTGTGEKVLCQVTLGPLYQLPFTESFANKEMSTGPWIISTTSSYVYTWGVDNPSGTYNNATAQDGDNGCAYMYNGSYYENFLGAGFISPKLKLPGTGYKLTFWLYNIATAYPSHKPEVDVYLRADDGALDLADAIIIGGDTEDGWKQYTVDLDKYAGHEYISFAFYGYTGGYSDVIYLDNISVSNEATGITGIQTDGAAAATEYYDLSGRRIKRPSGGVYILKTTDSNGKKIVRKAIR